MSFQGRISAFFVIHVMTAMKIALCYGQYNCGFDELRLENLKYDQTFEHAPRAVRASMT